MANICTNLFYASSERVETIDAIRAFIEENFPLDWYEQDDDFQIEAELYSRWDFPKSLFEDLTESLRYDNTLYMRCLSQLILRRDAPFLPNEQSSRSLSMSIVFP